MKSAHIIIFVFVWMLMVICGCTYSGSNEDDSSGEISYPDHGQNPSADINVRPDPNTDYPLSGNSFELPPEGDFDRDGVSNGDEKDQGTDPFDPSDALAWHPELGDHPRLLADKAKWERIKTHIHAGLYDYDRLFQRVMAYADMAPVEQEPGQYDFRPPETNAQIAKSATLAAFINDDAAYADKAIQIISEMKIVYIELPLAEYDQGTIHGGQALVDMSIAYDLLVGFGFASPREQALMREAMLTFAKKLYGFYITIPIASFIPNNHLIKFAAGLGMVGMTLNDEKVAAKFVNVALTSAPHILLDFQMPEGGGQGEGPNYLDYTFKTYLPFIAAYHRFASGESYPYKIDCRTRLSPACKDDVIQVPDPFTDPRMQDLLDWRIALVLPNGKAPPIDDANLSCGYNGTIAALFGRADYAWLYRDSLSCRENGSWHAPTELAFIENMPNPQLPEMGPSLIMENAGQAILRNDWTPDTHYALLIGEHGKARLSGIGHEQPDATSFIFYAMGDFFAIDSGYISWGDRMLVAPPENHNLILVDGQGPPFNFVYFLADSNAYLSEFIDEPPFRSVKVQTSYRGADVTRRLMLIGDDYFVTADLISSNRCHTYTWQLQTNSGGTTDGQFVLEPDGATQILPSGIMRTYIMTDANPINFYESEQEHGFTHSLRDYHTVLNAEVYTKEAAFLAVHPTAQNITELPVVNALELGNTLAYQVEGEDYSDVLIYNSTGDYFSEPVTDFDFSVESNAEFAWMRFDPSSGVLVDSQIIGGTYLDYSSR